MSSSDSTTISTSDKPPPDTSGARSASDAQQTLLLAEKLKQKIYASRPIFGNIIKKHGAKSLYDYSKEFFDINKDLRLESRRPICLHVIYETVKKRLGKKIAS